jgi:ferredoxin
MGVCMTCPARVVSGSVDQSAGMLDDEVQAKGYALMCVATPLEDCAIRVIEEEELLDEVLQASKASSA